jgi:hypothetical protein
MNMAVLADIRLLTYNLITGVVRLLSSILKLKTIRRSQSPL